LLIWRLQNDIIFTMKTQPENNIACSEMTLKR